MVAVALSFKELLDGACELLNTPKLKHVEEFPHPLVGKTFKDDKGMCFKVLGADQYTCEMDVWWDVDGESEKWHMVTNRSLIEQDILSGVAKEEANGSPKKQIRR